MKNRQYLTLDHFSYKLWIKLIDALQVQKNICGRLLCKISDFWKIIARTGFIVCTSWPNFHLLVYILSRMAFLRKVHFWGSIKTVALHSWVIDWPMAIHSQGGQWQQRGWVRSAPGRTPPSAPAFCVFPSLWLQQGLCFCPVQHVDQQPTADEGLHTRWGPAVGQSGHWECHPAT